MRTAVGNQQDDEIEGLREEAGQPPGRGGRRKPLSQCLKEACKRSRGNGGTRAGLVGLGNEREAQSAGGWGPAGLRRDWRSG